MSRQQRRIVKKFMAMLHPSRRPRLALPFSILPQPDTVRLVAGEDFRYTFSAPGLDRWLPAFLARLDGVLSVRQLLTGLDPDRHAEAVQILERLYGERAVVDGSAQEAHAPLVCRLAVEGTGPLCERLREEADGRPAVVVLAQDRLDYAAALDCNRRCRSEGRPWLWVSTGAMQRGYVSPLFLPDAGPCFGCLLRSFQRLSPAPDLYDALVAHSRNQGVLAPVPFPLAGLAILENLVRWKVEQMAETVAPNALYRLHVLECAGMEVSTHRVYVDSDCPECGACRL
jgi:bacteriocin biosynthesis cyclodehydratase domain-containing protein